jgi:hypothetical protein
MDNETKDILKVLGVAIIVLFLFKVKKGKKLSIKLDGGDTSGADSVAHPKTSKDSDEAEFDNAVISIKAVRSAINSGEKGSEIDKLNEITKKDYGIVVFRKKNGKLCAKNTKGEAIANEE